MAANATEISRELRHISLRGSNVVPITQSVECPAGVDVAVRRDIRVERSQGTGSNFGETGQVDRRSKLRNVKYAAQIAKQKMPVIDVALLICWLGFGVYLLLH